MAEFRIELINKDGSVIRARLVNPRDVGLYYRKGYGRTGEWDERWCSKMIELDGRERGVKFVRYLNRDPVKGITALVEWM